VPTPKEFIWKLFDVLVALAVVAVVAVVALVADVAVEALPDNVAVIVPAEKLPEASRATIVETVFALVAFEVTVNVLEVDWLAVNVAEPDRPVPDTAIVNVPLFAAAVAATHEGAAAPLD
jgi:hypothetical protein